MNNSKVIIALGTGSSYKINAVKKSLYELDFEFELIPFAVKSGVADQPIGENETKRGALNRAKNALHEYKQKYSAKYEDAKIGLGVEFGYERDQNKEFYRMICWAAIVKEDGEIFSEHSSSLRLPIVLQEALERGEDVSENLYKVRDYLKDNERGRLFWAFLKKRRTIYESVMNVSLSYLIAKEI